MLYSITCERMVCFVDLSETFAENEEFYSLFCTPGDGNVIGVENAESTFEYEYDTAGEYEFSCSIRDYEERVDVLEFTITVSGLSADAGEDANIGENQSIMLDGSNSTDDTGNGITYAWALINGPTGFYLNDPTVAQPTFTAPSVEVDTEFEYRLTVDNGIDNPNTDTVTITVLNEPDGPTDLPR